MNLFEIQAFITLAKKLHFTKTATELNMSPSALSRIITRLEDELHTTLFDRNSKQISLTENGNTFYKYALSASSSYTDLLSKLTKDDGRISGTLHVYASVTACYSVLPAFIKKLTEKYPDIHLSLETGDPAAAITAIKENRALLAVAAIPENGLSSMETFSIFKTPLIYAASQNGPYTKIDGSPQDILSSVPLILPKTGLARNRFDKWIKSRNVKPEIAAETEGNEAILALVQLGLGIGLVPQIVLENGPYKNGFIIHTAGNTLGYYDVGFIRKAEITGSESQQQILRAVDTILKEGDFYE